MTFVHPASIKSLRSELMNSTALTPTYHKGGGFAAVISVVAAIAIPIAAPAIASSMALSGVVSTIGMTATSALVGGALGAATAAIVGGDIGLSTIGGAIGGGIGGYNYDVGTAAAIGPGSAAGPTGEFGGLTAAQAGIAAPTAGSAGLTSVGDPFGGGYGGFDQFGHISAGGGFDAFAAPTGAPTTRMGAVLSGNVAPRPSDLAILGGARNDTLAGTFTGRAPDAALDYSSTAFAPVGGSPTTVGPGVYGGVDLDAAGVFSPAAARTAATPSLLDRAATATGEFFGDLPGKVGNAITGEPGQQVAGKLITEGVSQFFTEDPSLTAPQVAADARRREAEDEQRRLLGLKTAASQGFIDKAAAIDPVREGQQRLAQTQGRLARANEAGLRQLSTRDQQRRLSDQRRNRLAGVRAGGDAFFGGVDAATQRRRQLIAAGVGALPSGSGVVASAQEQVEGADARRESQRQEQIEEQKRIAGLVSPLATSIFGLDSEDDRKKRALEGA